MQSEIPASLIYLRSDPVLKTAGLSKEAIEVILRSIADCDLRTGDGPGLLGFEERQGARRLAFLTAILFVLTRYGPDPSLGSADDAEAKLLNAAKRLYLVTAKPAPLLN